MVRKAKIQMEKEIAENAKINPKKFWQYANSKRKTKSGIGELKGVKPLIHQPELGTYESSPFSRKKFLSLCSIVKTTEWNGLIKIDN
jgi:hypothetical protein